MKGTLDTAMLTWYEDYLPHSTPLDIDYDLTPHIHFNGRALCSRMPCTCNVQI